MRKLFAFVLLSLLTGCLSTVPQYVPFDPVVYDRATRITVSATRAVHQCATRENALYEESLKTLATETLTMSESTANRANGSNNVVAVNILRALTREYVEDKSEKTQAYCVHALSEIQGAARTLARLIGASSQYDMCDQDVSTRIYSYKASVDSGSITPKEFERLVRHLLALKKIDVAVCSKEHSKQLNEALRLITQAYPLLSALTI